MKKQSKFGYPNFNYWTLFVLCKWDVITDRQTDGQTDDPITRCPRRTFQAEGIKTPSSHFKSVQKNFVFCLNFSFSSSMDKIIEAHQVASSRYIYIV